MLSEYDALTQILKTIHPLPEIYVPLGAALHGFAPRPIHALVPLPRFDNSAMDGYAVRAEDTVTNDPLWVAGSIHAGSKAEHTLKPHQAMRIFTGAPMPEEADAVIMQEDVSILAGGSQIICKQPVAPGENVRPLGSDLCVGQRIVNTGDQLTPPRLAALASQGLSHVGIARAPRVAIVTTGDELLEPGTMLLPGRIFNSNATLLECLVRQVVPTAHLSSRHLPDDLLATKEVLGQLTAENDFLILSGGVSVGERDYVRAALQGLRIRAVIWRVKLKPGKPFLFAQMEERKHTCHIFGLPGNPVSSFVTFHIFVRPALLKALGAAPLHLRPEEALARIMPEVHNPTDRFRYVHGRFKDGFFQADDMQQSHALYALSQSNALLRMEPGEVLKAGDLAFIQLCNI